MLKLEKKDVCDCAEKRVNSDKYLKLIALEESTQIEKIMDSEKLKIYGARKMGSILMDCMAKSIDASVADMDPRKK